MRYNETGKFTLRQKQLAKAVASYISALRASGCQVYGKGNTLKVYKSKDMEHAQPPHLSSGSDYSHPIKCLEAGYINDSGSDDAEYFEKGYIMEE